MSSRFNFGLSGDKTGAAGEMPFLDHLEELRWRIIWSLLAFVVMGGLGIWIAIRFDLMALLVDPARPYLNCEIPTRAAKAAAAAAQTPVSPCDGRLSYFSITDPFFIQLKLGLLLGFLMSFPVIAYQAWAFLSPALHAREKRVIVPALYAGLLLFVAGAMLAYFYVLPSTVRIMLGFATKDLRQNIGVANYIDMVTKLMGAFGLVFELPVLMLILSSLGLVTSNFLRKNRRYAIAIEAIGASILTPGDALTATLYMMLPLMFLYEVSIWTAAVMERRRAKRLADLQSDEPLVEEEPEVGVTSEDSSDVEQW